MKLALTTAGELVQVRPLVNERICFAEVVDHFVYLSLKPGHCIPVRFIHIAELEFIPDHVLESPLWKLVMNG